MSEETVNLDGEQPEETAAPDTTDETTADHPGNEVVVDESAPDAPNVDHP